MINIGSFLSYVRSTESATDGVFSELFELQNFNYGTGPTRVPVYTMLRK